MFLGTEEYVDEAEKRINADVKYQELAQKVNDSYSLIFLPEPNKGVEKKLVLGFTITNGKMTEKWIGERPTSFIMSAPYGVYVDILIGKLNVNRAFISRKLKVKGPLPRLLKTARATERLVQVLGTIPTEFAGDYKDKSTTGKS